MAITLTCLCGKNLQVDDRFAGQQGRCPACGKTLDIPFADGRPAAPSRPPPIPPPLPPTYVRPRHDAPAGSPPPPAPPEQQQQLCNHGGGALEYDADFFVPPPAEVGELLSAHTTMRQGEAPMNPGTRAAVVLFSALGGGIIGLLIALLPRIRHPLWIAFWPLGLAALGAGIALALTRFKRACSYVGRDGVARFACNGGRDQLTRDEVFLFRDAHELRTSQTRHYVNGGYQGTNYTFTWTDINGVTRYVLSGRHNSEPGTPALTHPYYLATSAEFAWTMHLLGQLEAQLNLGGSVAFSLGGRDYVRVSPGRLELSLKGEVIECAAEDVAEARVDQGTFVIKQHGAREGWFSSSGVFRFPYNQLANAQLFLILLDKVAGIRLQ